MPRFDLPLEELRVYRPEVAEPDDFDAFWAETLAESRALAGSPSFARVESPLSAVEVYDVSFSGFGGDTVVGWFIVPAGSDGPFPAVVEYQGYGGGRGLPHEHLAWAASGFAYFVMDTRGQGSSWGTGGSTPDPHGVGASAPGFMTRGIESPGSYYYRRVFTDAVLAIEAVRSFEGIDGDRIAVSGTSQGGGIAIAAAALSEGVVAAMPNVPFLCHFERAVGMTDRLPYHEIVRYLSVHRDAAPRVFQTLAYFDGVNFAKRATVPALFSVGLLDPVCPPSTVFAARNHWDASGRAGTPHIVEYAFNEHEGGAAAHWPRQHDWLAGRVG
ncbi:acetylxylan esterase [Agromyces sp. Marseille-P2726]|uniref:acetylxylan esterase n=1 Tax=Agromyces sp. Marseille-P2726 TaxID=2709132 RepID=UPI00156F6CAA|nr:acetylxylan esterase [Agromyces sp. Marseille-P2726]